MQCVSIVTASGMLAPATCLSTSSGRVTSRTSTSGVQAATRLLRRLKAVTHSTVLSARLSSAGFVSPISLLKSTGISRRSPSEKNTQKTNQCLTYSCKLKIGMLKKKRSAVLQLTIESGNGKSIRTYLQYNCSPISSWCSLFLRL